MGSVHAHGFANIDERLRMSAAVDVERGRAEKYARHFAGCRAATDYREVLGEVDAVLLSLPHHLHHEIGMECIAAGKHVLMEKPLANTEAECLDLIRAAEAAGVTFMVAYCMRYHPLVARPLTDGPSSLQSLRVIWKLYEAEERGVLADLRGLGLDSAGA
jgi:predicted dehydrogenase